MDGDAREGGETVGETGSLAVDAELAASEFPSGSAVAQEPAGVLRRGHDDDEVFEETYEHQSIYVGPHPPASELKELQKVFPDAPRLIFEQFSREPEHRRALERMALEAGLKRANRAQIYAFAFAMSFVLLAFFAVLMNQPWVAGVLGVGTLASVVGAFLSDGQLSLGGKRNAKPDDQSKG